MEQEPEVQLGDILGEFRLLAAVSGILFGFLLNLSVLRPEISAREFVLLTVALFLSAVSILSFLMPVIYHHGRSFPLTHVEKRKIYLRSHRFALWGLGPLILSIYFALVLSLQNTLGIWGYVVSAATLTFPMVAFITRKVGLHESK